MLSRTIIENILILLGESFWVWSCYSQLSKLIRTKDKRGLSSVNMTLNTAANMAWVVYFASNKLWVGFFSNTLMFFMTGLMVILLVSTKKQRYSELLSVLLLGPFTAYLIVVYPELAGWVGVIFNIIAATPWLVHVLKTKKTSGISERALFLALGAMLSTLIYGLLIGSGPLVVGTIIGLLYEATIMSYYYRYRHSH